MESDSDYPYLKIYPPFSFYMNSESNPSEKERQTSSSRKVSEDSLPGSAGCTDTNYSIGNELPCDIISNHITCTDSNSESIMMPSFKALPSFNESLLGKASIQKNSNITNRESTVSNSESIIMHNCREHPSFNKDLPGLVRIQNDSNITSSECTKNNIHREQESGREPLHETFFENLCSPETTFDSSYALEYDNISDIEYDVDSGFNSAATSPTPTDCIDDMNLLNNSNTSDRFTPSPSGSCSDIYTSTLNQGVHHQFYGAHQTNFPTKETSITSTCVPESNIISSNYCAPVRSLLHNSGGTCKMTGRYDTVTVNTCYPRMYAGPRPMKPLYLSSQYSPTKLALASSPPLPPVLSSRMQLNSDSLHGYPFSQQTSNYSGFPFVHSYQIPCQGYITKEVRIPTTYTRQAHPATEINSHNYLDRCVNVSGVSSQWKQNEFEHANPEYFSYVVPSRVGDYNIPQTRYPSVYDSQRLDRCGETLQPVCSVIQHGYQPTRSEGVKSFLQDCSSVDSIADHTGCTESFEEHGEDKHNSSQIFPDSTTHPPEPNAPKRTKGKTSKVMTLNKPKETYMVLIAKAILASKSGRACLTEIYKHIMSQYSFYKETTLSWRNAVRHNLSTNECFVKAGKTETGRGFYWAIHPSCEEAFRKGNFDRRQARMKAQHASRTDEFLAMNKVPMSYVTPSYSSHYPVTQTKCHFLPSHLSMP